jgi:hypothetical protein
LGKPFLPEDLGQHVQQLIDRSREPGP